MASVIMIPNVVHVDCTCNSWNLVYIPRVVQQIWIFPDCFSAALEVHKVDLYIEQHSLVNITVR